MSGDSDDGSCSIQLKTLEDIQFPYAYPIVGAATVLLWLRVLLLCIHFFIRRSFSRWYRNPIGMFALIAFTISLLFTDVGEQYLWHIGQPFVGTAPLTTWSILWLLVNATALIQTLIAFIPTHGSHWLIVHDTHILYFAICMVAIIYRLIAHQLALSQIFVCVSVSCGMFLIVWDRSAIKLLPDPAHFDDTSLDALFSGNYQRTSREEQNGLTDVMEIEMQPMNPTEVEVEIPLDSSEESQ